jgi:hypothetical protein
VPFSLVRSFGQTKEMNAGALSPAHSTWARATERFQNQLPRQAKKNPPQGGG